MVKASFVIGLLCMALFIGALIVTQGQESVTELWVFDHRAYFAAEPKASTVNRTMDVLNGLPLQRTVTTSATNRTTVERLTLPTGYEQNRSLTALLQQYPIIERINTTTYASRIVATEYFPAVQVRGMVGLRNREGRTVTYPYTIMVYSEQSATLLSRSEVTVQHGQAVGIPISFTSNKTLDNRTRIVVALQNRTEHVQVWLEPNRVYNVVTS